MSVSDHDLFPCNKLTDNMIIARVVLDFHRATTVTLAEEYSKNRK
jgi:hypothetical protein